MDVFKLKFNKKWRTNCYIPYKVVSKVIKTEQGYSYKVKLFE